MLLRVVVCCLFFGFRQICFALLLVLFGLVLLFAFVDLGLCCLLCLLFACVFCLLFIDWRGGCSLSWCYGGLVCYCVFVVCCDFVVVDNSVVILFDVYVFVLFCC